VISGHLLYGNSGGPIWATDAQTGKMFYVGVATNGTDPTAASYVPPAQTEANFLRPAIFDQINALLRAENRDWSKQPTNFIFGSKQGDNVNPTGNDDGVNGRVIRTSFRSDVVRAQDGNDVIIASTGRDTIDGGAGTDQLIFDPKNAKALWRRTARRPRQLKRAKIARVAA
jgi:Ca2+-binding RTX toxin-like protein